MLEALCARARSRAAHVTSASVAALTLTLAAPHAAHATMSSTPDFQVKVNGIVYGAVHLGDGRTVLGGTITSVGSQARSNVGALRADGYADKNFVADTDGIVYAVAASADGGTVYLGGSFTQVNGLPRANLAAVDARSGAVLTDWVADTNGAVRALEIFGSTLYVGGAFNILDGSQKGRLVSLDTAGNLRTGFFPRPDWTIRDLAVSTDGSKVYASGGFNNIGGAPRDSAAELDASNGTATAFAPDTNTDTGLAVDVTPDGTKLFFSVPNNEVYAFDLASSARLWTVKGGGDTQAIEATNTEVFIGGHFRNITTWKVKRNLAASLYTTDGTVAPWNPHLGGDMGPWVITRVGEKLVVGGDFSTVNQGAKVTGGLARFTDS